MIRSAIVLGAACRGGARPCARTSIAGVDALVARPLGDDGPAIVFCNAATERGIDEPAVGRFLGGLAAAGYVAVAPELPTVRDGEVTPRTIEALVEVASSVAPRVGLIGASTGAGLAIVAASEPRLARRVTTVLAVAPFASLESILCLGTTGHYRGRPYPAAALVARAAMRSLAVSAPGDPAVPALLANRDPDRFDELYATLSPDTRALLDDLSPLHRIAAVGAPVELACSPDDAYFPVGEAELLADAGRDVRLTVTSALEHVCPRPRPGLLRVVAALERTLARAAAPAHASVPELRPAAAP